MSDTKAVELSSYSPLWPAVFGIERDRLLRVFQGEAVAIEHVGGTAVPGLGARPVIDILLGAATLAAVEARIPQLVAEGYRYVPELEKAIPERRFLVKTHGQPGSFNLHAVVAGGPYFKRLLAFRDALRGDAKLAQDYWKLRQRLAARFPNDRGAYTEGKTAFIREVVEKLARP